MRRVLWVVLLLAVGCGRESSIVPVISFGPVATPAVTTEVTPSPSPAPTTKPTPTAKPTPSPKPTPSATPARTPIPTPTPVSLRCDIVHPTTAKTSPPDAYLCAAAGELKGEVTHYSWTGKNKYDDTTPDPATSMKVTRGETMRISFTRTDTQIATSARYRKDPSATAPTTPVTIDNKNPATLKADFPTGTIWLDVTTSWSEGGVVHTFKLNVQ